jgi:glycine betaine/proline transport system substrate-binding protein
MKRPAFVHRLILAPILALAALLASANLAAAADSVHPQCQVVRLSDIGWTDVTATTALTSLILQDLGYQPKITVLSVPVTFAAMKNKDVDVFMGNWMPSQIHDQESFVKDGSVEVIRPNL